MTVLIYGISQLSCGTTREVRQVLSCVCAWLSPLPPSELTGGALSGLLLALRPLLAAGAGKVREVDEALSAIGDKIPAR